MAIVAPGPQVFVDSFLRTPNEDFPTQANGSIRTSKIKRVVARSTEVLLALQARDVEYTPLPTPSSIRILKLNGDSGPVIECQLQVVDLKHGPIFNALSYTWGIDKSERLLANYSVTTMRTIRCDGRAVRVQVNLYNALLQFRKSRSQHPLWVDAICINQSDAAERSAQIDMMDKIYSSAGEVLVWLGKSSWHTKRALEFMATVPDMPLQQIVIRDHVSLTTRVGAFSDYDVSVIMVSMLMIFFRRGWFHRTWTLQEACLARNLSFWLGRHKISPRTIHNAISYLLATIPSLTRLKGFDATPQKKRTLDHNITILDSNRILLQARELYAKGVKLPLEDALILTRGRLVTDPRDKVFGVLSISDPASLKIQPVATRGSTIIASQTPKILAADVTKSATDVYIECARCLISGATSLKLLSFVGQSSYFEPGPKDTAVGCGVPNLPSWVPDFTLPIRPRPLWAVSSRCPIYTTTKTLAPQVEFANDGRELLLGAHIWDTVGAVGEGSAAFAHMPGDGRLRGDFLNLVSDLGTVYAPTQEPTMTAMWRTLIANSNSDGELPAPPSLARLFTQWLAKAVRAAKYDKPVLNEALNRFAGVFDCPQYPLWDVFTYELESSPDAFVKPLDDAFAINYLDRCLFSTRKGYLGIAPWTMREGDVVAIVAGAYVPYIIRRAAENNGWVLIGEAYIHGIMFGEAMTEDMPFDMMHIV